MGNIIIEDTNMKGKIDKWTNPREFYLKSFVKSLPSKCPECGGELLADEDEIICEDCGLIVSASIRYVAGHKIDLPQGLRL